MIVSSNVVIFLRQITRIAQSRTRSVLPLPAAPVRTSAECQNNVTPAQRTRSLSSLSNSYAVTWVWNAAFRYQAASQTLGLRFVRLPLPAAPSIAEPPILPGCEAWFPYIFRFWEPPEDSTLTTGEPAVPRSQIRIPIQSQSSNSPTVEKLWIRCGNRRSSGLQRVKRTRFERARL